MIVKQCLGTLLGAMPAVPQVDLLLIMNPRAGSLPQVGLVRSDVMAEMVRDLLIREFIIAD